MTYLLLSIAISSLIFLIFKGFARFNVDNFQAIVINYIVASSMGFAIFYRNSFSLFSQKWFPMAVLIGSLFITLFLVMAIVSQKQGISVASVSVKMSVAIPVIAGVILYKEKLGPIDYIGIVLSMIAVFLVTIKKERKIGRMILVLPIVLFIGNGILDALLKYSQEKLVPIDQIPIFTSVLFGLAGTWGLMAYPFLKGPKTLKPKSIIAGLTLGIPNFGSIYFLLMAFEHAGIPSSKLFPINNVGIVVLSTIFAILVFKEQINKFNWLGILLGIISILLLQNEQFFL